jgi:hypothetical protein
MSVAVRRDFLSGRGSRGRHSHGRRVVGDLDLLPRIFRLVLRVHALAKPLVGLVRGRGFLEALADGFGLPLGRAELFALAVGAISQRFRGMLQFPQHARIYAALLALADSPFPFRPEMQRLLEPVVRFHLGGLNADEFDLDAAFALRRDIEQGLVAELESLHVRSLP